MGRTLKHLLSARDAQKEGQRAAADDWILLITKHSEPSCPSSGRLAVCDALQVIVDCSCKRKFVPDAFVETAPFDEEDLNAIAQLAAVWHVQSWGLIQFQVTALLTINLRVLLVTNRDTAADADVDLLSGLLLVLVLVAIL